MKPRKLHNQIRNKVFRQIYNSSYILDTRRHRKIYRLAYKTLLKITSQQFLTKEIIGIQEIDSPVGTVFHLNYVK